MIESKACEKLEFKPFSVLDRELYEKYLFDDGERGCEFSFANLFLWGRQRFTHLHGNIIMFSQFNRRSVYPYPVGDGDKRLAIDAIIEDARARDIPCRITGLSESAKDSLESLYPGRFRFHCDEGGFDYVYSIDDLAELSGKKYDGKRNHINRFHQTYPDCKAEPIGKHNIDRVKDMVKRWYDERLLKNPNSDFHMEMVALGKALDNIYELDLEGLALVNGDTVLAMTLASRLSDDTLDVHFEKALSEPPGAYAAINREFAKYIREKYPNIRFLNREEDMGIEGLRKAKRSYHPHHMVEKCWACLLEDGYDY